MNLVQVKNLGTNIIASLDVNFNYDKLGIISRIQSSESSKFVYSLGLYTFPELKIQKQIQLYSTYSQGKHLIKFIGGKEQKVCVVGKDHIWIYNANNYKLLKQIYHGQVNIYDIDVAIDAKIMILAGQNVRIWSLNTFIEVQLPNLKSARLVRFSKDNKYFVSVNGKIITIYNYKPNQQKLLVLINQAISSQDKGDISSLVFNPIDSQQIALGYVDSDPDFMKISSRTFFRKFSGSQPNRLMNPKQIIYSRDGHRLLSSDFTNGVGVWPGINQRLFYKQNYLLYNIRTNDLSTLIVGYVWKSIKILSIQVNCSGKMQQRCQCPNNQIWNYSTYKCQPLICNSQTHSTGLIVNGQCVCLPNYIFSQVHRSCIINCSSFAHSLKYSFHQKQSCQCQTLYQWNSITSQCQITCLTIPYSLAVQNTELQICKCKQQFKFDLDTQTCECFSPLKVPIDGSCRCIRNYIQQADGTCIINCTLIPNANPLQNNTQSCQCLDGYYFNIIQGQGGCRKNCTEIVSSLSDFVGFDRCLCAEKTVWDGIHCKIICETISFAYTPAVQSNDQRCQCAVNYIWLSDINECGKDCRLYPHTNITGKSTLYKCNCISNYQWSETNNRCQIKCESLNFTNPYPLADPELCECRSFFEWNASVSGCEINCSQIYGGRDRVNGSVSSCICQQGFVFNNKQIACEFSFNPLSVVLNGWIVGLLVVGGIIVFIIVVMGIRACYNLIIERQEKTRVLVEKNNSNKNMKPNLAGLRRIMEQGSGRGFSFRPTQQTIQSPVNRKLTNNHNQKQFQYQQQKQQIKF